VKFRPGDIPMGDPHPDSPVEWEDNWLSNLLAYLSHKVVPSWCHSETHFTAKVAAYLWTDCPCCAIWRGLFLGALAILFLDLLIGVPLWLLYLHRH
jgi:hypothetical protein